MTALIKTKAYKRGLWGEAIASLYLMVKGYRIIARRYKTPVGEIDILAKRKNTLIAIEVKTHQDESAALYAVTPKTQNRITRAVEFYLSHNPKAASMAIRFDVITIKMPFFIRHIDNAWRPRA